MITGAALREINDTLSDDQIDAFTALVDHLTKRGFVVSIAERTEGSLRNRLEMAFAAWVPGMDHATRVNAVEAAIIALPEDIDL